MRSSAHDVAVRCGAQSWVTDAHGAPSAPALARSSLPHDAKVKDFMVGRGGVNLKAPDRKWAFPIVSGISRRGES